MARGKVHKRKHARGGAALGGAMLGGVVHLRMRKLKGGALAFSLMASQARKK